MKRKNTAEMEGLHDNASALIEILKQMMANN